MAYKPKYARKNAEAARPEARKAEPVPREPKKTGKGVLILFIVLGIVTIPLSCVFTARLMGGIWENVGRPKSAVQEEVADRQMLEFFDSVVSAQITAVRSSMRPAAVPDLPEEVPPVTVFPSLRRIPGICSHL